MITCVWLILRLLLFHLVRGLSSTTVFIIFTSPELNLFITKVVMIFILEISSWNVKWINNLLKVRQRKKTLAKASMVTRHLFLFELCKFNLVLSLNCDCVSFLSVFSFFALFTTHCEIKIVLFISLPERDPYESSKTLLTHLTSSYSNNTTKARTYQTSIQLCLKIFNKLISH